MEKIFKELNNNFNKVKKMSIDDMNRFLFRALPAGTIRQRTGGKFKKMPDGSWQKITEPKRKPGDEKEKPKDIEVTSAPEFTGDPEKDTEISDYMDENKDKLISVGDNKYIIGNTIEIKGDEETPPYEVKIAFKIDDESIMAYDESLKEFEEINIDRIL